MVRKGVILGRKVALTIPELGILSVKAVHACHSTVSFSHAISHCCHSHCCRSFFAPMWHRTAGTRTFDIRTLVSFTLLTLSHCWHSHCWLRTGVVRNFVFHTPVVQLHFFLFEKNRRSYLRVCKILVTRRHRHAGRLASATSTSSPFVRNTKSLRNQRRENQTQATYKKKN